jgi:hypothetical protein
MRKRLFFRAQTSGTFFGPPVGTYYLRQGLTPLHDDSALVMMRSWNVTDSGTTYTTHPQFKLSPDKRKLLLLTGYNAASDLVGNNFTLYLDTDDLASAFTPSFTFTGHIRCGALSNTYAVIAGTGGAMSVLDLATQSLLNVNRTGLGTIYETVFTDDGQYLYVAHSSAPYVRRYSIADWNTYTDLASGVIPASAGACYSLQLTPHGVLVSHYGSVLANNVGFALYSNDLTTLISSNGYYQSVATYCHTMYDAVNDRYVYVNLNTLSASYKLISVSLGVAGQITATYPLANTTVGAQGATGFQIRSAHLDQESGRLYCGLTRDSGNTYIERTNTEPVFVYYLNLSSILNTGAAEFQHPSVSERRLFSAYIFAVTDLEIDTYKITGTVRDADNFPVARVVRAYRRSDGILMAETLSNATTGEYLLELPDEGPYDVQFQAGTGELLNDLFYARTEPEPVVI